MLKGFSGYLQTDGYSVYNVVESVTRVGCWAHARRKWVDCFEGKKPVEGSQSEKAFAYVEKIFALEACWRDMSPDERQKHRMAEMKPVMDAYWDFLSSFSSEKDSNLQKAQTYSLHQRKQLEAVLLDGRLELTNNVAERSAKPIVMARRNMTADLTVSFTHGRAIQIVRTFQHGILAELLLDAQHGFLQGFLALQFAGVGEEIHLQDALILDYPVGGYCYSPHS